MATLLLVTWCDFSVCACMMRTYLLPVYAWRDLPHRFNLAFAARKWLSICGPTYYLFMSRSLASYGYAVACDFSVCACMMWTYLLPVYAWRDLPVVWIFMTSSGCIKYQRYTSCAWADHGHCKHATTPHTKHVWYIPWDQGMSMMCDFIL